MNYSSAELFSYSSAEKEEWSGGILDLQKKLLCLLG